MTSFTPAVFLLKLERSICHPKEKVPVTIIRRTKEQKTQQKPYQDNVLKVGMLIKWLTG